MVEMMQGPGVTARGATPAQNAQAAQLDAQLEIEAKKAALRGLQESNAGGPAQAPEAPEAPAPPGMPKTTVVIQKDGNTTVLENPTPEQLQQVGFTGATRGSEWNPMNQLNSGQVTTIAVVAIVASVAIVYMVINAFRKSRGGSAPSASPKDFEARMARIENAIDSVAVEVERISENQRFTTKVLSEGAAQNLNVPEIMTAVLKNRGER